MVKRITTKQAQVHETNMDSEEEDFMNEPQSNANDIQALKEAMSHIPNDTKDRNLRACMKCYLIMTSKQWSSIRQCENGCPKEITPNFSGMTSMILPSQSWVARYHGLSGFKPGIYALKLINDEEGVEDYYEETEKPKKRRGKTQAGLEPDVYSDDAEGFYQ